ncbi:hypothetical protein [Sunxiuqinia dokdonensis]|uniref:Uncharacterized protein n=1 Tax=Sunxiuqinia dokdonensis TaxID=1409788 RepID=A0A0L8V4I5_9BACT|nr:hypothetical protein [Sunxiuqinia dokdonensis]KOH43339.1 hypothetical protein NC99_38440 [Sunxiuqinia dokdonensis]
MKKNLLQKKKAGSGFFLIGSSSMHMVLGMVIFLIITATTALGQSVNEFGTYIAQMKESPDDDIRLQAARFESLTTDLHPNLYIEEDGMKAFGEGAPVCAFVDVEASGQIYDANPLFRKVELLTIKLTSSNGLNTPINLSLLEGFQNLKYILIRSEFACTEEQVESMLTGSKADVIVCYTISFPE